MMASPILVAEDIQRTFFLGKRKLEILRGVSFSVAQGEHIFLTGASGAGKTSLLYCLAGLERPSQGRVLLGQRSLYDESAREQSRIRNLEMGYIFQNYHLLPELTALENVLLPARIRGKKLAKEMASELLAMVNLSDRLDHLPTELSGGEQQRVAIARSLMNDPQIIFADEPTGNLDSKASVEVMDLLLSTIAEKRKTLIVVTHDLELAALGDRKLHLVDGRLT